LRTFHRGEEIPPGHGPAHVARLHKQFGKVLVGEEDAFDALSIVHGFVVGGGLLEGFLQHGRGHGSHCALGGTRARTPTGGKQAHTLTRIDPAPSAATIGDEDETLGPCTLDALPCIRASKRAREREMAERWLRDG
jgi:hypothetical protein